MVQNRKRRVRLNGTQYLQSLQNFIAHFAPSSSPHVRHRKTRLAPLRFRLSGIENVLAHLLNSSDSFALGEIELGLGEGHLFLLFSHACNMSAPPIINHS